MARPKTVFEDIFHEYNYRMLRKLYRNSQAQDRIKTNSEKHRAYHRNYMREWRKLPSTKTKTREYTNKYRRDNKDIVRKWRHTYFKKYRLLLESDEARMSDYLHRKRVADWKLRYGNFYEVAMLTYALKKELANDGK